MNPKELMKQIDKYCKSKCLEVSCDDCEINKVYLRLKLAEKREVK